MTRYVDDTLLVLTQVLNADGSPATSATVTCIFSFFDSVLQTREMTHLANGIYMDYYFAPSNVGSYTAECICGNPVYRQTYVFLIEARPKNVWVNYPFLASNTPAPVQNQWYTACEYENGVRLDAVAIQQTNDESAAKNMEVRITWDQSTPLVSSPIEVPSGGNISITQSILFGYLIGHTEAVYQNGDLGYLLRQQINDAGDYICDTTYREGCKVKIEYRITDANGTNQNIRALSSISIFVNSTLYS